MATALPDSSGKSRPTSFEDNDHDLVRILEEFQLPGEEWPMKDYPINIFWSENDASYVADIPDLFPCTGFGETPQRALAEVMLARAACLETARDIGLPFPEATSRSNAERGAG